jgi:hypothetical protein
MERKSHHAATVATIYTPPNAPQNIVSAGFTLDPACRHQQIPNIFCKIPFGINFYYSFILRIYKLFICYSFIKINIHCILACFTDFSELFAKSTLFPFTEFFSIYGIDPVSSSPHRPLSHFPFIRSPINHAIPKKRALEEQPLLKFL